ncbi:TPA: ISL3 family transposase [Streptococcus equi subsp. zooepidemicus]|uniref:ISL3 family transposase n=1 Tax=Streptococcus equi TaxID=1336 RepID=UPI00197E310A|nr:ISL3 family transposase [Streptococcus equi]QUQ79140.1 ISL3 family transposase IS1193 [Streptococcus equi subsp. zooepidemicus]HEL1068448.1 ISL3 family transposase [Streptococcus equi subsp. zooepidemicus]HEL1137321.1 ISL3 family transposase [Streptococcus equi subsp. zooepidemicus]HEL1255255.1 ISL3 family transposase [Streptococcus equi subsp. zooepidemicus]HEL1276488.1 ISL3 family transposase [Streptococcus equi subsp. zooepidemicus]
MEHLNNTTQLIGIKDKHITLTKAIQHDTHIEVIATLDYNPPKRKHCRGKQIKYDFQKPSKIPFIEIGGFPSLIRLKKRRFQCKSCRKVTVSETTLVKKNCQISEMVRQKITQLLLNREALTHIASKLAISTSTVYRKLKQYHFREDYANLPEVLSWDEFSYQKGKLAFIAQDFNTKKIITILDNRRQTTIRNHFFKYSKEARNKVKVVTVDMSGSYIPLIKILFPKAKIVLDRFHIVQHMSRALKYYWRLIQKDSRKLSLKPFYSRTFRQTLTPRECLNKIFSLVPELNSYYDLYQLLLFHLQEKNAKHFFGLIHDTLPHLNQTFKTALNTFSRYQDYITNAIQLPYSNAKLEATNKLIKDIKRNAFGFRNFDNFKKRIFLALNIIKEKTTFVSSRA